jgi:two-component sensor histidine kinase/HAMP domain-containing protein
MSLSMKLSTRLTLLFLMLSLTPLLVIGYIGFRNGLDTMKMQTMQRLVSINIDKAAEVNRWIHACQSHLKSFAQRPLVRAYAFTLSSDGISRKKCRELKQKLIEDHFIPGIEAGMAFVDLSLLNKRDGRILVSTDARLEGLFREEEDFFREGQKNTFVDDVNYSLTTEKLVMHVSTPVMDADGNVIAVLTGHVDWHEMSKIMLQSSGMSNSEESYIINKFNFFVTESRFVKDYLFTKSVHTQSATQCLAHNNGVASYIGYRGIPVIGAYRWMPEWKLCLITEENEEEALAAAIGFRRTVIGIGAVLGGITIGVSLFFVRTITERIGILVRGAREFAKGNLDYRIPAKRSDEIGHLANAFNQMAHARQQAENIIKRSRDKLELRVKARTKELEKTNEQLKKEIAERQKIEDALRESEERYRDLVENLDTAVVVYTADTRIVLSNFRSQELLGLSEDQMMGKTAIDLAWYFVREDGTRLPLSEYPVNLVLSSGKALNNYILGIHNPKVEQLIWVMANAFPKFDAARQIEYVVVTFWDITYRVLTEEKIQRSLSEKEVLLKEVHHRVKNNLQMIQSLLNLQAAEVGDPLFKEALTDSNSRIKSMALIHETLYRSEDIGRLSFEHYIKQLVTDLHKVYSCCETIEKPRFQIEEVELDMDMSIACGLIINELVTNAFKYAFNNLKKGIVEIRLHKTENNHVELMVRDNGVGLPDEIDMNQCTSLGLKIVSMLAEDQLQGTIHLQRGSGTAFRIRFPILPNS